jgi:hypothetical protein
MRIACRGERAMTYDLLSKMADGRISGDEADAVLRDGPPELGFRLSRRSVGRREPIQCLRLMTKVVESTNLPESEQRQAEVDHEKEVRGLSHNSTVRMLVPAVTNVGKAMRRKTALIRCLLALVAAERYRLSHGRWPDGLAALKPELLAQVPNDPYDGAPLRYRKLADGVVVYSISEDGTDDGGNLNRNRPTDKGVDVGYRLWDAARRRQPSPRELPPPEVEAVGQK